MAIALPLIAALFEPVQGMVDWLAGGPAPRQDRAAVDARPPRRSSATALTACRAPGAAGVLPAQSTGAPQRRWSGPMRASVPAQRPVRVVRVVEQPHAPARAAAAGRMVISGRMADVCAELDRLVAAEACH